MKAQYELVEIRKREEPKAPDLSNIKQSTKETVLRLLSREGYQITNPVSQTQGPFWIYIDPHSSSMIVWCFLYLVVFYLVQLQISLSIAFGPQFFENQLQLTSSYRPVYIFFLAFMAMDIIVSFFVGYYAFGKGKVVDDPKRIAINYVTKQFIFDIVTILLYIVPLIYQSFGLNLLQIVTAGLLWIKKFKYQGQIEVYLQYYPGLRAIFLLFFLFVDALMLGNYGACLFIWLDVYLYNQSYYGTGTNSPYYWLTNNVDYSNSLIDGPWYDMYVYGQEYSTGTLSTLAPGPFPKNPWQLVYVIFVMIFFMIYASYLADLLIQIVYTYSQPRRLHEENILAFDSFMRLKQVGQHVRMRIYNYFQLKWELEFKTQSTEQEAMINKLPINLKEDLLLEIGFTRYLYFLERLPKENQLKKRISLKIERTTADANTIIFKSRQPQTNRLPPIRSIFFIKEGMAKFYLSKDQLKSNGWKIDNQSEALLNLSNVERVLGVYEFITGQDFHVCCATLDLCLIQTLPWSSFQEIIADLNLKEQFQQLRHRVLYERQLNLIHKACIVCLKQHIESECPYLYFYKSLQKQAISGQRLGEQNKRRKFIRREIRKNKTIKQEKKEDKLFSINASLNLGILVMDLIKIQKVQALQMEEVWRFEHYWPKYNIQAL